MAKETFDITLAVIEIRGRQYGSSPAVVTIGTAAVPTYAVSAGADRWVSTKADCIVWLTDRGLTKDEAILLLALGDAADQARTVSLDKQERQGVYLEEVGKIVDSVVEACGGGKATYEEAVEMIMDAVKESSYVSDRWLRSVVIENIDAAKPLNTAELRSDATNLAIRAMGGACRAALLKHYPINSEEE